MSNSLGTRTHARGLCRMKMLPVMILAKYHSSAWSVVSERSNSSARLISQSLNPSARLVFERSNSSARRLGEVAVPQSRRAEGRAYCKRTFIATCYVLPHKLGQTARRVRLQSWKQFSATILYYVIMQLLYQMKCNDIDIHK